MSSTRTDDDARQGTPEGTTGADDQLTDPSPGELTDRAPAADEAPGAPLVLVLHGARGDLSRRSVYPALATLQRRRLLPQHWALLGTGREDMADDEFRAHVAASLEEFGHEGDDPEALTRHSVFCSEVGDDDPGTLPAALERVRGVLADAAGCDRDDVVVVHYLAIPPAAFEPLTRNLGRHGLTRGPDGRAETVRVVYEKPYGTDPDSFHRLDAVVHDALEERQVFRIDHFLGKEATQNLHVLRFANELFESVWCRDHVEQVQIDVPETLDVAQRAEFYDATGAALDMVVSHLFQVAAQVAMEPPKGMSIDNLVAAREAAIACFRPLDPADDVVLGQFEGYRDIEGVDDASTTDTFIAARLWVDNDRWRGVPFLLRTGKRMAASAQRVTLVLRRDPVRLFGDKVEAGLISLSLKGDGAIEVTTSIKKPGPELDLVPGTARLDLSDVEGAEPLSPYASLVHDVLVGDRTLFTTPEGLEEAWRAFAPMLGDARPDPLPYAPGSWGPAEADRLAEPHGWVVRG
ncbi:glucose-6-phosphate dehydrogenase [Cellulomonas carbonis]|uniref:Glucose-6-phosphate 1-dehydrogenase n=1 Tax=Cellulomonas carbonis T26 TaxID=947969 RepID=A0A0A0BTQ0_9CELL|nr:glucose-6-phosphate dehydrogenase [Cellulomonas carbonis]KGM10549.1 glucose-6-phosphate dehydrogenase [Cellulomonas carbonis T26]GGC02138.1 glucose-6-phosphate 1-dehydrogenase [Cellulomonas carbonis]